MQISRLHLIGGAPLTGKSTLANNLARGLPGVAISTDNIREWMQRVTNKSDYPELFSSHGITAEQYYQKYPTAQAALEEEILQGEEVAVGVRAFLDLETPWETLIIEGIAITPQLAREIIDRYTNLAVTVDLLVDQDEQRIRRRIANRGLWGPTNSYPEHLQAIEAEWTILYNQWFEAEAAKYGFPVTYITNPT
ncbi:MAG TPA: hypothetical protein VI322_04685 [Candidatus Saccharimonadia bacterium]